MQGNDEATRVWVESERPFTLRLSRTREVTTDGSEWATVSPIGERSILVVVSGSATRHSTAAEVKVFVPVGARVSVPCGMTAYNEVVEVGLEIAER